MRIIALLLLSLSFSTASSYAQNFPINVECPGCNCGLYAADKSKACKECCLKIKAVVVFKADTADLKLVGFSPYTVDNIMKVRLKADQADTSFFSYILTEYRDVLSKKEYAVFTKEAERLSTVDLNFIIEKNARRDEP